MSSKAAQRGELAFRPTSMGSAVAEPGSRKTVKGPQDNIDSLGSHSSVAIFSPSRRRVADKPYSNSNMAQILSERGESGPPGHKSSGSLTAPLRPFGQYSGGEDSVVLGDDKTVYECGSKEAQMRLAHNPELVLRAAQSPVAGQRLVVRDRTSTRTTQVGGADSINETINDGTVGMSRETIQEAQRKSALDPTARQAAADTRVAGGGSTGAFGERGLRVTRPVGGATTHSLDWMPTAAGGTSEQLAKLRLRGGVSSPVPSAAVAGPIGGGTGSTRQLFRPRDSLGAVMSGGAPTAGDSDYSSRAGGRRPRPEQAVGGNSAPYLDNSEVPGIGGVHFPPSARPGGDGAGMQAVLSEPSVVASASSRQPLGPGAVSRLRVPQPVGGRSLGLDSGLSGIDAPHPAVGGRSAAPPHQQPVSARGVRSSGGHMASSLTFG